MPDVYEPEESQMPDFQRYLDIARRRHLHFLLPLLLGWGLVWGFSWTLRPLYKSSTLILVERPTIVKSAAAANVNNDLQGELLSLQEQILSRTRLLMIIDKLHLYDGGKTPMAPDDKVAQMRKEISIDVSRDVEGGGGVSSFTITYAASTPQLAQQVTTAVANLFIDSNLAARRTETAEATQFLEEQLETARAAMAQQQEKVSAFELTHGGALPGQQPGNVQILTGLQTQLQSEQDALNNAIQQRAYDQSLIEQYKTLPAPVRNQEGQLTGAAAYDAQLDKLRDQLADLRSRYTDSYPDVQKLKIQIAETERLRDQAKKSASSTSGAVANTPENIAMSQVQSQLQANQIEIANRQKTVDALKAKITEYQARLDAEPASQQELANLTQGADQLKANYDDLLKKKQEADMAAGMEQSQVAERFSVLDPPSLPDKPFSPNRLKFCAIGLVAGIALGSLVVLAFELADDRVHREEELKDLLPFAILSEVPEISSPADQRRAKAKIALGWVTAVVVLTLILAGSAVSYLHG